jgi:hypothetical protein
MRRLVPALLMVLAGCGGPRAHAPYTAATLEEQAAEVDRTAASMEKKSGGLTQGDADSKYTAWFENGRLRRIDEKLSLGDYGASSSRYYYDGVPYFAYEEKERNAPQRQRISLRLYFDRSGKLLEGRKSIDGDSATVEDTDIRGAYSHAIALRDAALQLK